MRVLIPHDELIHKLTILASARAECLDTAFWADDSLLGDAVRDGMEALMELARIEGIGWILNAGWRCDVDFELYGVEACDNLRRFSSDKDGTHFETQAATPQGALAAAILAILEARRARHLEPAGAY